MIERSSICIINELVPPQLFKLVFAVEGREILLNEQGRFTQERKSQSSSALYIEDGKLGG
jgi:hypothetical protein